MNLYFPMSLKAKVKGKLLQVLHAKPEITARVATRIVREGIPRYLEWNYEDEKKKTLQFIDSMRVSDFAYKFSNSSDGHTLYGSSYACMLLGMYGEIENSSLQEKQDWLEYFDGFQDVSDGLFRDPALACPAYEGTPEWGDGWGARHLTSQLIISYARLGRTPRHPFKFLDPYYDATYLKNWLDSFDFTANVWAQSNYIMNIYTLLQYARDFIREERAAPAVQIISHWLAAKQRDDTGMWHEYELHDYPEIGDAIRGAYHFYPIFVYDKSDIAHPEAIIDTVLRSQNSWGGFNPEEVASGACEDIDAIEPLIRASIQSCHRRREVEAAIRRAMVWILACQNGDGGFESIPEHAFHYGSHPLTTSRPSEGSLFSTWFRTLCLAYIVNYLGIKNNYNLGFYPGYEMQINELDFGADK